MWAELIGAGLSAGAAVLGTHMRNEAQKRESELAYKREQMAIREQNSYNSASAQMARLQAAGLNPNLMYQSGQEAAAGTQSDIARYQPAELDNPFSQVGSISKEAIDSMIGIQEMQNKVALTQSELVLNEAYTAAEWAKCNLDYATATDVLAMLGLKMENMDADTQLKRIQKETSAEQRRVFVEEAKKLAADTKLLAKHLEVDEAQIRNLDMQTRCQLALLPSQIKLNEMSAEERMYAAQYAWGMYNLEYEKFGFETGEGLEWKTEQNKKDRQLGYVNGVISLAGVAASLVTKGGTLGAFGGINPLSGSKSMTYGSPINSPKQYSPSVRPITGNRKK